MLCRRILFYLIRLVCMRLFLVFFFIFSVLCLFFFFFFFQAEDGIRDIGVTGVQTCALPIYDRARADHPRGQRDALSVVARRVRDDAAPALGGGERQQLVQRAADLEGSRALEILALERHAIAARVVERL